MNQGLMQELEMKAQMKMQMQMVKSCFSDCVQDFRTGELSGQEKSCMSNCAMRDVATFQQMANSQGIMQQRAGMGGQQQF